jgi:hypothetical protein
MTGTVRQGPPDIWPRIPVGGSGWLHLFKRSTGAWPSGKAPDFDSGIHRFESCRPCHLKIDGVTDHFFGRLHLIELNTQIFL